MTPRTKNIFWLTVGILLTLWVLSLLVPVVFASEDDDGCRNGHFQCGHDDGNDGGAGGAGGDGGDGGSGGTGGDGGEADANAEAIANAEGGAGGAGGGGDASVVFGKRAPTNFLYMQNQVEACGRTFGFSGSNTSGGWAFGIPIPRSWTPTCDLWKAAEEAQQNQFVYLSYMFQCSINAVRNVMGDELCSEFESLALVEMGIVTEAPDLGGLYDQAAQSGWMLAEVTEEEYIEQQQMIADKFAQYDNLIEERQKEHELDDAEIARLQEEAAAREAELKKDDARRAAARAVLEDEGES
jgi:uncharacterized small protein (DUF1192 family)